MSVEFKKLIPREINGQMRLVMAPEDHQGEHELVLVRRRICGVEVLVILAARATEHMSFQAANDPAAARQAYGFAPLRVGSPEELFLACDRSQYPALPASHFPDIKERWSSWTNQVDAEDPSGYAWAVLLVGGFSARYLRSFDYHVRAVCPSQELLVLGEEAGQ